MTSKRNLRLRHKTWYAVRNVPAHIKPLVGKKEIVRTCDTHSLIEANHIKHKILRQIDDYLEPFYREWERVNTPEKAVFTEAHEMAKRFDPSVEEESTEAIRRANELERTHSTELAVEFYQRATRKNVPCSEIAHEMINEATIAKKGKNKMELHIGEFVDWAKDGTRSTNFSGCCLCQGGQGPYPSLKEHAVAGRQLLQSKTLEIAAI